MEKHKLIGALVVLALVAGLGLTIWTSRDTRNSPTAAAVTEGFNSYEEMMAAHHPESAAQASDSEGCGGVVSGPAAASFAGQASEYGIIYDQAGYEQLLKAANIRLSAEQTKLIVGLDVAIPCCGFRTLQASGNCECGHHVALYNLATILASKGYARDQIQSEIDKWKQVFFPEGSDGNTGGC